MIRFTHLQQTVEVTAQEFTITNQQGVVFYRMTKSPGQTMEQALATILTEKILEAHV